MNRLIAFLRPRLDAGLLLALALSSLALVPLAARPGLPNGDDVLYHAFRAAEMDRAWTHGVLTPRWAEAFYTGYGSPLFHYYASLSYYLTSLALRLGAPDALSALRWLVALALLGGAGGMYQWLRPYAGRAGGVAAALAFTFSPYILYTEPYARGAYPEMLALGLFPPLLAAYSALVQTGTRRALALAALGTAALILTHNLMALALGGLLGGWLVWELLLTRRRTPGLALAALTLGAGLAAGFWLPALAEGGEVRLQNLTATAELEFRRFFVPLEELLAGSPRADGGALNGLDGRLNLGVAQWGLALAGMAALALRRGAAGDPAGRRLGLYFALAGLGWVGLMLPAALPIWERVPGLPLFQFPWRFLGPAAISLSAAAAFALGWLARLPGRVQTLAGAALAAGVLIPTLPLLYVPEWTHTALDTSAAAFHAEELAGRQRATTFSDEYLPRAVVVEPGATPRLLADYADGYPVDKAHLEALPAGVQIALLEHGPQHDAWRVTAPAPFTLEVLTFAFAGWAATVDGQPAPITPSDPHGLITLPVPAGEHVVRLALGATPARDLSAAIAWASGLALAGMVTLLPRLRRIPVETAPSSAQAHRKIAVLTAAVTPDDTRLLVGLALGGLLALAAAAAALRPGIAWWESPPGQALPAQHAAGYRLGESIRLLGYDLNATAFRPGDRLRLRLYWYAAAPVAYGYASFVHLSAGGPPLAQADKYNPAGVPTLAWTPAGYIQDDYALDLPLDLPSGTYQLLVGLYTCDTRPPGDCGNGDRAPVTDAEGNPVGDAIPLAVVEVR